MNWEYRMRELKAKAAPGPWSFVSADGYCDCSGEGPAHEIKGECPNWSVIVAASIPEIFTEDTGEYYGLDNDSGRLLVALRNDLPAIIRLVRAARNTGNPRIPLSVAVGQVQAALADLDGEEQT